MNLLSSIADTGWHMYLMYYETVTIGTSVSFIILLKQISVDVTILQVVSVLLV